MRNTNIPTKACNVVSWTSTKQMLSDIKCGNNQTALPQRCTSEIIKLGHEFLFSKNIK